MPKILKLSDERGEQLRQIAAAEGKTMVAVVEDFIRAKAADGVIPADLPGVSVMKRGRVIEINTADFAGQVPLREAKTLSETLRAMSRQSAADSIERRQKLAEGAGALSGIKVERMANGVRLVSPIDGKRYPVVFNVAEDLADQIEREAGKQDGAA